MTGELYDWVFAQELPLLIAALAVIVCGIGFCTIAYIVHVLAGKNKGSS